MNKEDALYYCTFYDGNGDSYSGYGIASAGTHYSCKWTHGTDNETDNLGYYHIASVSDPGHNSQ